MLKWSKYFQSPEYLSVYRTMLLNPELREIIMKWIGLKDNMKVLDVGCGTGAFTYYLSKGTENCSYFGLDIDETFISRANKAIIKDANNYRFIQGDAVSLPFPDDYFDVVTSYTFLTNMPNGKRAMKEMKRVVKKTGTVSSVTAQDFTKIGFDGNYPVSHADYYFEYSSLRNEIYELYEKVQPISDYAKYGTSPKKVPLLYSECGFSEIKMYPIGWCYSLSNSAVSDSEKELFIKQFTIAEKNKFNSYMELPEFNKIMSLQKSKRYLELLDYREKILLDSIGENNIWEWEGGSQLLMTAKKDI